MGHSLVEQLSSLNINNVFLYVADAVREDALPARVRNRGVATKGIASSTHSPSAFSTIVSGVYPPSHGVYWFSHQLQAFMVFDLKRINTYYNSSMPVSSGVNDSFFRIFDLNEEQYHGTVSDIEPPFFAMERGHGGHAPYIEDGLTAPEYFRRNASKPANKFRRDYDRCVTDDAKHFTSQITTLEDRGLLDDTLVIYTSDHGELLGEGGMLGHNAPMRPELVYVPVVFCHPELDEGTAVEGVVRHIDFLPTILHLLGCVDEFQGTLPGRPLSVSPPANVGLSFYEREYFSSPLPGLEGRLPYGGAWDALGGHVVTSSSALDRLAVLAGKLTTGSKRGYLARHPASSVRSYLRGSHTYGRPQLSQEEARHLLEDVSETNHRGEIDLSETASENLRDLGYL